MIDSRPEWIKQIRKGDVLKCGRSLRVVRNVKHCTTKTYVIFAIKRCSWTTRCYTVYSHTDLKTRRFELTGKRLALQGELDYEFEQNIGINSKDTTLHCCDVEGMY
jgi:hypothetical protein